MTSILPNRSEENILQEVHHRINNSLQVISSLLDLEVAFKPGVSGSEIVQSNRNRIMSMALLHRELYHSRDFIHTDIGNYVSTLSQKILATGINQQNIDFTIEVTPCEFTADTLIPLGLILNECLEGYVNQKYHLREAIKLGIQGRIDGNQYVMTILASGRHQNLIPRNITLSQKLITGLSRQIKAEIEIQKNDVNSIRIRIPIKK